MTPFVFSELTPLRRLMLLGGVVKAASGKAVEDTVTGNPAVFETDLSKPLKSLVANFLPVQSSGTPSPENVLPITGWTGLDVMHGADQTDYNTYPVTFPALGKNLFNKNDPDVKTGVWWNGNVLTDGSYNNYKASEKIPVVPGQAYYLNRTSQAQNAVCYFGSDSRYIDQQTWDNNNPSRTIPSGVYYIAFTVDADAIDTAMFEKGNSASPYEPFINTIYGGCYDLVSGVLTAEWVKYKLSDFTWTYVTTGGANAFRTSKLDSVMKASTSKVLLYCDTFKPVSAVTYYGASANKPDLSIFQLYASDERRIMIKDEAHTDPADFRNTYGNVEICYALLTPQEIQLTPQQINTLIGNNTVWSDANGDCEVIFMKKG